MRMSITPRIFPQRRILTVALAGLVLASVFLPLSGGRNLAYGANLPTIAAPKPAPLTHPLSAVAMIGRDMFSDTALSASGRLSCASCHNPRNHYGPDGTAPVVPGGAHLDRVGRRAVPTLSYKFLTPAFTIGPQDPSLEQNEASPQLVAAQGQNADASAPASLGHLPSAPKKLAGQTTLGAPVPRGGLFWDGRADTLEDQAEGPFFTSFEMANTRPALAQVLRTRYGARLAALFGANVLSDEPMLISEAAFALARYQIEDPSFHAFSSKFDAYLSGHARLSPAEARGLALFNDPTKGNCAACHLDTTAKDGTPPLFTDFEYEALGVPRNSKIPANADPNWHDLGLCGPMRHDATSRQTSYCGLFKTPTLRNVATRHVFFHNGVYTSLQDVLDFYARRDSDPQAIYPVKSGKVQIFNDLPRRYHGNIDVTDAPFGRKRGDAPALSKTEQADIIAFLNTLTDGYHPHKN